MDFLDSISTFLEYKNDTRLNYLHQINFPTQYKFNYRQILLLINLLYTIPSIYIYSKCRKILSKSSRSSNHFNTIFKNDFCINIALFMVDFLSMRVPISGLINNYPSYFPSGYLLTIIYFLSYYLIYANYFSITLICLNRMTSVVFPHKSTFIWKQHICFSVASIYILSLIPTWQMFTYIPYFIPLEPHNSRYQMIYQTTFMPYYLRNSTTLAIVSFILAILCISANISTIMKYRKTNQKERLLYISRTKRSIKHRQRSRRTELVMFVIAIIACSSLVLQCIIQVIIMIFTDVSIIRETAQDMRNFCLDLSICCPPWILYYSSIRHKAPSEPRKNQNQLLVKFQDEFFTEDQNQESDFKNP